MNADQGRTAVYAAEVAAFDGTDLETRLGFDDIDRRVAAVTSGEWWPGPPVVVSAARRDASSSSTRCNGVASVGSTEIRFAAGQLTIATAAHELAHALAGVSAGHGPLFRAAYLDVIAVITNLDSSDRRRRLHVGQLASAFADAGLDVARRRWPEPPEAWWQAIAL